MIKWITPNTIILSVFIIAIFHIHACSNHSEHKHHKGMGVLKSSSANAQTGLKSAPVAACDSMEWEHVYDPDRLQVLNRCITVTGTIAERNADEDGDEHMLLRLDNGQEQLLQKKNYTKKEGCLVVEVVCVNTITRKRALGACTGYTNHVLLPEVGDHVRVMGSYVLDGRNGWAEIHPATKIEPIK